MPRRKRRIFSLYVAAAAALVVLYPRTVTIAPEFRVAVINGAGRGLPHVDVYRGIQDYSWGDSEVMEHAMTDNTGVALFPLHNRRLSTAAEVAGCLRQILAQGAHAGCGVYSNISVNNPHLLETGRSDQRMDRRHYNLRLTMADCPSGDYWACRGYPPLALNQ